MTHWNKFATYVAVILIASAVGFAAATYDTRMIFVLILVIGLAGFFVDDGKSW